jgi:hypothetical protein
MGLKVVIGWAGALLVVTMALTSSLLMMGYHCV